MPNAGSQYQHLIVGCGVWRTQHSPKHYNDIWRYDSLHNVFPIAPKSKDDGISERRFQRDLHLPSPPCENFGILWQFCLDTFHGKRPVDLNFDAIYVILDGCPDEDMQGDNNTFQALASVMDLQVNLTKLPAIPDRFEWLPLCNVYTVRKRACGITMNPPPGDRIACRS